MFDYLVEPMGQKRNAVLCAKHRRTAFLTIGSALLAVAPKCPICFLAYFGIFGVATTSASVYRVWLPPVTAMWLAFTVGMLTFRSGRHRYGLALLGFFGALGVLLGKFVVEDQALVYAGIAALVGAVVWRSFGRATSSEFCPPCPRLLHQDAGVKQPAEVGR
jgi:hypothetical protein